MEFIINTAEQLNITDAELTNLLTTVYVDDEFVGRDEATTLFEASAVKERGLLIGARDTQDSKLAGLIIIVTADSPSCKMAKDNEAEIHLLAVSQLFRRQGLGKKLVEHAINNVQKYNYSKIILWTQLSMNAAQCLYKKLGFVFTDKICRNGRDFLVFEMKLTSDNLKTAT